MPIHTGRLVLAPQDAARAPRPADLVHGLQAARFLGPSLYPAPDATQGISAYAVGDDFLHLVSFTGCAVQVDTAPNPGRPFCHIRIVGPSPQPGPILGVNTRAPRCPVCRAMLRDWRDRLAAGPSSHREDVPALSCAACGSERPACVWDWKDTGGFARLSVWIEEIFPGEAVPTDALMSLLSDLSAMPWRHFYVQDV
jgi:hypothetical protein